MNDGDLSSALDRAEQALGRVERSLADRERGREGELRQRVREVVAGLDDLIREASHG